MVLQGDGETFEFPDIFKENKTESEKQVQEFKAQNRKDLEVSNKYWDRLSLPLWFR